VAVLLLHRPAHPEYSRITLQTMVYLLLYVSLAIPRALQNLSYFFLLPFGFSVLTSCSLEIASPACWYFFPLWLDFFLLPS
jgi:hypothetical protein